MMIVMCRCEDGGKSILVRTYIACTMVSRACKLLHEHITQYGSTVYIGMAMVVLHYSHT